MAHSSVSLETPIEFINITPLNPLISKCQIKVCYVQDTPNRNGSIITEEVARKLANSLPGSPIVGYYNKSTGDFEQHNKQIDISNGEFKLTDSTRPYGFVDLGAKVWFQDFLDDGQTVRKYLMTEGYLWTGQYPECQRVIDKGNNESMELHKETLNATWTKDESGKPQFFIINEAIMEKLCILGEDFEPCFEGSSVTAPKVQFSFDPNFTTQFNSMVKEMKNLLDKGGTQVFTTYAVKVGDSLWNALYAHTKDTYSIARVCEDVGQKYAILQNRADQKYSRLDFSLNAENEVMFADNVKDIEYTPSGDVQFALADVEAFETEFKKKEDEEKAKNGDPKNKDPEQKKDDPKGDPDKKDPKEDPKNDPDKKDPKEDPDKDEPKDPEKEDPESDDEDKKNKKDKKKTQYSLEEIPEYQTLKSEYSALEGQLSTLKAQLASLEQFKLDTERVKKQEMIDKTFYMLSNEDKKDVIDHIDEYSLDDIESKLSVICVRNKVNFSALENDDNPLNGPTTYNLGNVQFGDQSTPAWVQAVLKTAETLD